MRPTVVLAVLLTAGPAAAAGERVDVLALDLPDLVVADVAFEARVTLANRLDEPVTAVVYGVLYAPAEGGPCGAQTSPRWRGVVSLSPAYAEVPLAAGETRTYPDPGRSWTWRVDADLAPEDAAYEVCAFAGEQGPAAPSGGLAHDDAHSARLRVRPANAAPVADFTFAPATANVTTPFLFRATAEDADGDPVTFAWDFGDRTAKGAAVAEGAEATHRFYPEGDYRVELAASDGFATTRVAKTVRVLPEEVPTPPQDTGKTTPAGAGALAAVAVGAFLGRRR